MKFSDAIKRENHAHLPPLLE